MRVEAMVEGEEDTHEPPDLALLISGSFDMHAWALSMVTPSLNEGDYSLPSGARLKAAIYDYDSRS